MFKRSSFTAVQTSLQLKILQHGGAPGHAQIGRPSDRIVAFLLDLAEDWQQHGREVFKRVRRESPAAHWMRTLLINADALILLAWALARYPLAEILKFQAPSSPSRARKFRACYHILDTYAAKTSAGSATADFTIPTSSPVF